MFGSVGGEGNEGGRLRSEDGDGLESLGCSRETMRVAEEQAGMS